MRFTRSWYAVLLAFATVAVLGVGCEEEPPEPNLEPVVTSVELTCEAVDDSDIEAEVLVRIDAQVKDENLGEVSATIGGMPAVALIPASVVEEQDPEVPQAFSVEVDATRRILCVEGLEVEVLARDQEGAQASFVTLYGE